MTTPPAVPGPPPREEPVKAAPAWRRLPELDRLPNLPPPREWGTLLRISWRRLLSFARAPQPPPPSTDLAGSALYGAAQPLLGLRILANDLELLREALVPVGWLAAFCALIAILNGDTSLFAVSKTFYKTFAALAVAPPILFGKHYARLAAQVRYRLGFGACGPREGSLWFFAKRSLQSVILVSLAVAPIAVLQAVPILGFAAPILLALWGLHWVVVDALDDARVLLPGETLVSAEAAAERSAPPPWFVRAFYRGAEVLQRTRYVPGFVAGLARRFARICDRLSVPWREEIELLERHRAIGLGFAVATTALLATPVLNLLFRPIIIVAAVHLLGHLEPGEAGHGHPGAPAELAGAT
jgi:Etoposide-induced protein 2.4 (EI24)